MSRKLSNLELSAAAGQWQLLEAFAAFLADQVMGVSPESDALRYIRYFHNCPDEEWEQVEAFRSAQGGTMPLPAQHPSEDVPEFEISSVAMQVRLLFGFAAQFTMEAAEMVTVFLKDHHGYSGPEWDAVLNFLEVQEQNNRV